MIYDDDDDITIDNDYHRDHIILNRKQWRPINALT